MFNFHMLYATHLAQYSRIYINAIVDTVSSDKLNEEITPKMPLYMEDLGGLY
jgi:hypothetical protein